MPNATAPHAAPRRRPLKRLVEWLLAQPAVLTFLFVSFSALAPALLLAAGDRAPVEPIQGLPAPDGCAMFCQDEHFAAIGPTDATRGWDAMRASLGDGSVRIDL